MEECGSRVNSPLITIYTANVETIPCHGCHKPYQWRSIPLNLQPLTCSQFLWAGMGYTLGYSL